MQEVIKEDRILTINDVASILRCSKTHVSHVLAGKIAGIPRLTHIAMGHWKLVRREWLDQLDGNQQAAMIAAVGRGHDECRKRASK